MDRPAKRPKHDLRCDLPANAAFIVASYLNPYDLLLAAQVSRSWYAYFTSDLAWAHYDVHGLNQGIFNDFMSKKGSFHTDGWDRDRRTPNYYFQLACLSNSNTIEEQKACSLYHAPKSFYLAFVRAYYRDPDNFNHLLSFEDVPWEIYEDRDLVKSLLKARVNVDGLENRYLYNIDNFSPPSEYTPGENAELDFILDLLEEHEVAQRVVECLPEAYKFLSDKFKADADIFRARARGLRPRGDAPLDIYEGAPSSFRSNRELALELLHLAPFCVESLSQDLQEDCEVVKAAFTRENFALYFEWPRYPRLSPVILNNKDCMLHILGNKWIWGLEDLPEGIRTDKEVLRLTVQNLEAVADEVDYGEYFGVSTANRHLLRRVYALRELDFDKPDELEVLQRALVLEFHEIENDCTFVDEMVMRSYLESRCNPSYVGGSYLDTEDDTE